jgi:hypothetical protein
MYIFLPLLILYMFIESVPVADQPYSKVDLSTKVDLVVLWYRAAKLLSKNTFQNFYTEILS